MIFNSVSIKKYLSVSLLLTISIALLTACSSDDENTPVEENNTVDITNFKFSVDANMPTKAAADGDETRFAFDGTYHKYKFTTSDQIMVEDSHGNTAFFVADDSNGSLEFKFLEGKNAFETNAEGMLDLTTVYPRRIGVNSLSDYQLKFDFVEQSGHNNYTGINNSKGFVFSTQTLVSPSEQNPSIHLKPRFAVLKLTTRVPDQLNMADINYITLKTGDSNVLPLGYTVPITGGERTAVSTYNYVTMLNMSTSPMPADRMLITYLVLAPIQGRIPDFIVRFEDNSASHWWTAQLGNVDVNWEEGKYYEATVTNFGLVSKF